MKVCDALLLPPGEMATLPQGTKMNRVLLLLL
jgi:hypothetical protein